MFTGSITENRISVGLPPCVRQVFYDEARRLGMKFPELIRHHLINVSTEIERDILARKNAKPEPGEAIVAALGVRRR